MKTFILSILCVALTALNLHANDSIKESNSHNPSGSSLPEVSVKAPQEDVNNPATSSAHEIKDPSITTFSQKSCTQKAYVYNFADVVEPVITSIVNVYTSQNPKEITRKRSQRRNFNSPGADPFRDFFEQFENFFGDDGYVKPGKRALGSGFIIDQAGYVVTNHHVVDEADEIHVKTYDRKEYHAKLIGSDPKTDLALLKIESDKPFPFIKFGNSDLIRLGEPIVAIGNPFGLECTVTYGIVSSKSRDINLGSDSVVDGYIQTDAAINSGNSGGPMINICGEVIGINTAILSSSGGNVGIGFAIPSNIAEYVIEQLKSSGKVSRTLLNIMIQELTPEIAEGMGLKDQYGVLVTKVTPNGIGEKAGLKAGDIIISLNGVEAKSASKLKALVAKLKTNEEAKFVVLRDSKKINLSTKIVEQKDQVVHGDLYEKHGVTFSNITNSIATKYGIRDVKGIMVTQIDPKAKWRGLEIGDIIISVNQRKVENIADFQSAYEAVKKSDKKNIVLNIIRGDLNVFLAFPIN